MQTIKGKKGTKCLISFGFIKMRMIIAVPNKIFKAL
jgi:hypothetical protein